VQPQASTTKEGFDDEDLYDELAPDECGARFSAEDYTLEDAIGSHVCSLEDLACV
jgi:hypothetical protein